MFTSGISAGSSLMQRMSAGRGVDAVEQRVRHLQNLIQSTSPPSGDSFSQQLKAKATPSASSNALHNPTLSVSAKGVVQPPTNLNTKASALWPLITQQASQHKIDPALIAAVIQQESGFNANATSKAGAQGLMQLMPATAKSLGVTNSLDPAQNIAAGTKYLSQKLSEFNGNIPLALAAYNAGSGAVKKHDGIPPYAETQGYVRKILSQYLSHKNA